jgi:hypothetical protein
MEQAGPLNEAADDGRSDRRRVPDGGTLGLSDARWAEAHRRAVVIAYGATIWMRRRVNQDETLQP